VERTLRCLSMCRAILVRYEKKAANYLGAGQRSLHSCSGTDTCVRRSRQIPCGLTPTREWSTLVAVGVDG
jgi:hypothetical protein